MNKHLDLTNSSEVLYILLNLIVYSNTFSNHVSWYFERITVDITKLSPFAFFHFDTFTRNFFEVESRSLPRIICYEPIIFIPTPPSIGPVLEPGHDFLPEARPEPVSKILTRPEIIEHF